jgi:hypothetical protein
MTIMMREYKQPPLKNLSRAFDAYPLAFAGNANRAAPSPPRNLVKRRARSAGREFSKDL